MWSSLPWFVQLAVEFAAVIFLFSLALIPLYILVVIIKTASKVNSAKDAEKEKSLNQSDYGL